MGKMFTTKKRVRPVFVEDTDKTMFAEVCPAYGLPADFYEMGAMDELGFYYVLKSLKNGMAEFSDLKGYMFSVSSTNTGLTLFFVVNILPIIRLLSLYQKFYTSLICKTHGVLKKAAAQQPDSFSLFSHCCLHATPLYSYTQPIASICVRDKPII